MLFPKPVNKIAYRNVMNIKICCNENEIRVFGFVVSSSVKKLKPISEIALSIVQELKELGCFFVVTASFDWVVFVGVVFSGHFHIAPPYLSFSSSVFDCEI